MLRNVLIASLIIGSVCAVHLEFLEIDSAEDVLSDSLAEPDLVSEEELPGVCWACKWAMNKLKKQLTKGDNADAIKTKLLSVCDQIGFLKSVCRKVINKYIDVLVEELSTTDDPQTICTNIKVCKSMEMLKFNNHL